MLTALDSWKRQLHLLHRWLGIGCGVLVLLWFGSGIVMMYVPYPSLSEAERMASLAPLDAGQVRIGAWDAWQALGLPGVPAALRLNSVAGHPTYHFMAGGRWQSVRADSGNVLRVDAQLAQATARAAAPQGGAMEIKLVERDQWTFGSMDAHRPLYRVEVGDAAGSVLYVSSRTGEAVRDTTRAERAWNWAGSVIHWLYFTPLRSQIGAWRQVVMWSSAAALLLAMLGMVLGIQRLRLARRYAGGRRSPYRGWQAWHHWLGLGMGTLTLTWLFSGWLSVSPFAWLASPGVTAQDRLAFAGGSLTRADLGTTPTHLHADTLELEWRRVDGTLYYSALERTGRPLLDAHGVALSAAIPEAVLRHAVQAVRPQARLRAAHLLASGDDYYYRHHRQAPLPVLRAEFDLPDDTTFYVDPAQGQLVGYANRNSKWHRWLFNGLHQLDVTPVLRTRPVWDLMLVPLCLLGAMLSTTGLVLGWRRLRRR
ncbi:MAG TPA: PepSY domain-containing protein [Telluria sp.]|jgi:hypothetical protein